MDRIIGPAVTRINWWGHSRLYRIRDGCKKKKKKVVVRRILMVGGDLGGGPARGWIIGPRHVVGKLWCMR